MPVLSAELVHGLARRRSGEHPVVSLFLNVDGREKIRREDYLQHLEAMIRDASSKGHPESVVSDLGRIVEYVENDFDRGNSRGLAMFVSGSDLWEVVPLPVPVEDHLVVNMTPHVRELETILDEYEPIGVLLTDKQRARLLVVHFSQIVERDEVVDPVPRHDDDKGDWGKDHVKTHATTVAHQHFRHAAQAMFELHRRRPFKYLLLCVAEELATEMRRELHAYLRAKVVGRSNLPVASSDDEIVKAAIDFAKKAERRIESEYVNRLRAAVAINVANGRSNGDSVGAVAGLDNTLKAVFERRVDTLLVSEGYEAEGWRCRQCTYIATVGRKCKMCGSEMSLVQDVVEEAVEDALNQSCRVEFCSENADLDVMGRIGALLRF